MFSCGLRLSLCVLWLFYFVFVLARVAFFCHTKQALFCSSAHREPKAFGKWREQINNADTNWCPTSSLQ